jgi:hypothetical protein
MKATGHIAGRAAALALALAFATTAAAETSAYAVRSKVDWKARVFLVDVELDLKAAGIKMPEGRLEAQLKLEHDFPGLAKDAVFALQADSHRTVEDAVADGSLEAEGLLAVADRARLEGSSLSKDMRKYRASYAIGLEAISAPFLSGARPTPIRPPIDARPVRDYSGIVVYAKGKLPVHGEGIEGKAAPSLFPRIYDEDMGLVLDRAVVVPEVLAEAGPAGGVLGYASALGVEAGERVGGDPMRVMAKELFGDSRCDYVVSREDALRILSSPANRELLHQGKVVVVLDF